VTLLLPNPEHRFPLACGPDPGTLGLVIDGGELPGTPSTVIDLRGYEESAAWTIVRPGLVTPDAIGTVLAP
jgi:L-threonylcarbamoyladenylate synthase